LAIKHSAIPSPAPGFPVWGGSHGRVQFSWRLEQQLWQACNLQHGPRLSIHELDFLGVPEAQGIRISMDSRARLRWTTCSWNVSDVLVKSEDGHWKSYETGKALREGLKTYFLEFNAVRFHQLRGGKNPDEKSYENQLEKKVA